MGIRGPLPDRILDKIDLAERKASGLGLTAAEGEAEQNITLERNEQARFRSWLERNELPYAWSRTDKKTRTNLGVPDFTIACFRLAIEFKLNGRKLTPEQERWKALHEARGGTYNIVPSYVEAVKVIGRYAPELTLGELFR